jgi:integrase
MLDSLTLGELVTRYRDTVVVSKRSASVEIVILNAFLRRRLACMPLGSISAAHFSNYRDERLAEVAPSTVIRELGILQHALETAKRDWAIPLPNNPVKLIAKPKGPKPRQRRLEPEELGRLLAECDTCRNPFIRPLVTLAVATGMRLGELLRIEAHHVRLDTRTLLVPITKNDHPRTIPLSPVAAEQLEHLASGSCGRLIPISPGAVKLAWRRLVKRAQISDLHFHDLRHEAITRLFERGLSLPEVALIGGHRDPRMLFRYTHLRAEDVAKKLNEGEPAKHPALHNPVNSNQPTESPDSGNL